MTILLVIPTHLFRLTSLMQCQNVMSAHHVSGRPDLRSEEVLRSPGAEVIEGWEQCL